MRISFTAPFYMATKTRSTPIWKCRRQVTMCVDANLRNEPNQHHNQTITPILTFHDYQVTAILKPQVVFSFSFRVNVPVKQYDMTNVYIQIIGQPLYISTILSTAFLSSSNKFYRSHPDTIIHIVPNHTRIHKWISCFTWKRLNIFLLFTLYMILIKWKLKLK